MKEVPMVARNGGKPASKPAKKKSKKGDFMKFVGEFRERLGEDGLKILDMDDAMKGVRHPEEQKAH